MSDEADALSDPLPGEFALVRRLGRGAFGDVWLGRDLSPLDRHVALKFMRLNLDPGRADAARRTLLNEAGILASLRHPHIVTVFAWRDTVRPGESCLVMQYIPGGSFDAAIEHCGPIPWQVAARYVCDVSDGLELLHGRGIIHRDIKPHNILHDTARDEAVLTDFGIAARLVDPRGIGGTRRYMAPESFRGEVSPALDVYALGATFFTMLTAQPPFPGADESELLPQIRAGLPRVEPRLSGVPEAIDDVVRRTLSFDADRRPTVSRLRKDLRRELNRLLADDLPGRAVAGVRLSLNVFLRTAPGVYEPIRAAEPTTVLGVRDASKVPLTPARVVVHTGERIRIRVRADRAGRVAVFGIGPTGNFVVLAGQQPIGPDSDLDVLDAELTPPTGRERLFAVWTAADVTLAESDLAGLAPTREGTGDEASEATRHMMRVRRRLEALPPDRLRVAVVELDHQRAG